ncbi:class I SAM-dependent methyltransferase [Uliginosibacterium sp. 31-12]|uniref:class I SAM-dependent methyltransferase n=1 Tax=Uliginosibacterium sp. 31-12 TaxID=3062781 RepID=UPI0026E2737F|nr:class I SAM-dependent methyltransferase [Uliginosibacterium sp. 31-12]MDO6385039.1 class I SAM-dependent methyltransferase [Uliginosibacterium sp. 31-12]
MNSVNFGLTAQDYRRHRAGFPDSLFTRLTVYGVGINGQRVLDIGTGTGSLGRGFARRGCLVTGLDPSAELIAQARELDAEAGVSTDYVLARIEDSTLPAASFDLISAGQCWHWFDRPRAAAMCAHLLRPGGLMLCTHFDWLPWPGTVVEATEKLILEHNPDWRGHSGHGVHYKELADLTGAGFHALQSFTYDEDVLYSHAGWRGRIRASAGVAASLSPEAVHRFDTVHAAMLTTRSPAEPLRIPHRVFALIGRMPLSS